MPAMDYDRVAHLYDAYVRTDVDIPFLLAEAKKANGPVLELMCGTGRVSMPLLEAGIDLTCVDSSAGMLAVLRGRLRESRFSAELVEADVCKLSLNRQFDLIFIPFHSFAEITGPAEQRQALNAIRAHLSPGGRFICTLHNPPVRLMLATGRKHELGNFAMEDGRMLRLSSVENYDPVSARVRGTQFYEICGFDGAVSAAMAVDIEFCLHSYYEFKSLAEAAGFVPVHLYGDYSYGPFDVDKSPVMIWVLRPAAGEMVQHG